MWFSLERRVHLFYTCARASRIEDGSFSECGSRFSAARIRFQMMQQVSRTPDYEGATATLTRGVSGPGTAFWHDSRPSRRNRQFDPWRWNPENNALARFRVFKRLSSNEVVSSMDMNRCRGLSRGSVERGCLRDIVDHCW
eukprot:4318094-Pyramimonas_sp.AAC.1